MAFGTIEACPSPFPLGERLLLVATYRPRSGSCLGAGREPWLSSPIPSPAHLFILTLASLTVLWGWAPRVFLPTLQLVDGLNTLRFHPECRQETPPKAKGLTGATVLLWEKQGVSTLSWGLRSLLPTVPLTVLGVPKTADAIPQPQHRDSRSMN